MGSPVNAMTGARGMLRYPAASFSLRHAGRRAAARARPVAAPVEQRP